MMDGHDMYQVFSIGNFKEIFDRGGLMEENHRNNYTFKNCPFQFLNHWGSAESVFCSEQFSFFLTKTETKACSGWEYSNFAVCSRIIHKRFFQWATFKKHSKEL